MSDTEYPKNCPAIPDGYEVVIAGSGQDGDLVFLMNGWQPVIKPYAMWDAEIFWVIRPIQAKAQPPELLPCPKGHIPKMNVANKRTRVFCWEGAPGLSTHWTGPICDTEADAIAEWNRLMKLVPFLKSPEDRKTECTHECGADLTHSASGNETAYICRDCGKDISIKGNFY